MSVVTKKILKISEKIPIETEVAETYIPPVGSTVIVKLMAAEGVYSESSATKLIWDYGGDSETTLWSIRGTGVSPNIFTIPSTDTDGIKSLAITADNGELVSVLMSVYVYFKVKE